MYKLYNVKGWGSLGPHLLLDAMGVPFENVWMTPEQVRAPEYRRISPLGYIPALGLADGTTLFESLAITVFLTSAHADKGLAPLPGTAAHGEYLSWLTFMSVNIYGAINLAFHGDAYTRDDAGFAFMKQKAVAESNRLFGIVEKRLAVGGPFLLGADFSAADLYLFMLTIWAKPSQAELLAQNPHIAKVCAHVRGMGSLRAALEAHGVL